jgi:hypothetical protein
VSIYAVNGKEPIAAWIPSLDTAGNGTTTVNDLIGSNNGTLTNMDAATDWVADTAAGGVRALDFDGTNDHVVFNADTIIDYSLPFSVSFWTFLRSFNIGYPQPIALRTTGSHALEVDFSNDSNYLGITFGSASTIQRRNNVAAATYLNNWRHVVLTYNGGGSTTAANYTLYDNGAVSSTTASGAYGALSQRTELGGRGNGIHWVNGRQDDIRVWNVELDATDVAYLYNGGAGRGIVASTGKKRPRINGSLINSGLCRSSI